MVHSLRLLLLLTDHLLWHYKNARHLTQHVVSMQLLPVISGTVEEALLRWLRAAELTCDRAALLVAQVPHTSQPAKQQTVHHTRVLPGNRLIWICWTSLREQVVVETPDIMLF